MNKQREALELALKVLNVSVFDFKDAWHGTTYAENKVREIQAKASDAIREALAEPELARKPLTDEQIDAEFDRECWATVVFADGTRGIALDKVTAKDFARAIERAHGIGD